MMRAKNLLVPALVVLGLAAAAAIITAKKLKKVTVYFEKLRVHTASLSFIVLKVDLLVENPSKKQLILSEVIGRILYNGKQISDFSLYDKKIILAPRVQTRIPNVTFRIESLPMLNELLAIVQSGATKSFLITGTITVDGITFPFSEGIE